MSQKSHQTQKYLRIMVSDDLIGTKHAQHQLYTENYQLWWVAPLSGSSLDTIGWNNIYLFWWYYIIFLILKYSY